MAANLSERLRTVTSILFHSHRTYIDHGYNPFPRVTHAASSLPYERNIKRNTLNIKYEDTRIAAFKWMPGVLSTSIQRQFRSFGRLPFHGSKACSRPTSLLVIPSRPYLPISVFCRSSPCFLISKDADLATELPGIPRGFLKWLLHAVAQNTYRIRIYTGSKRLWQGPFIRATPLIFNLGHSLVRSFVRSPRILGESLTHDVSFARHQLHSDHEKQIA